MKIMFFAVLMMFGQGVTLGLSALNPLVKVNLFYIVAIWTLGFIGTAQVFGEIGRSEGK